MGDEREEIRRRLNIVDLVAQRVTLQGPKQGKWKGLCPFHDDKNPSFEVNPSIGRYHCWACGEKGDIFTWVMKTRNVEFREALEILAREAGVELEAYKGPTRSERLALEDAMEHAKRFFELELKRSEGAKEYCESRGLDDGTLAAWEVGYAPDVGDALAGSLRKEKFELRRCKELFLVEEDSAGGYYDKFRGRLMFPIRDEHGKLVAFGGRVLGDGHPKYINSSDTPLYRKSNVLYGMHRAKQAIAKEQRAVLVEGYLDVIACHRAGLEIAVASLGTALAAEQAKLLARWCRQIVVLYDADEAGKKAADRAADLLQEVGLEVRIALMPPGEDPDTLLRTQGAAAVVAAAQAGLKPLAHRIGQLVARADPHEEAFWTEAFEILSEWRSPLELDEMVVRLAPLYPHTKDPTINQKSIRSGVLEARRRRSRETGRRKPAQAAATAAVAVVSPARSLASAEKAVLHALLDERLRERAWEVVLAGDLFFTQAGDACAAALRNSFVSGAPKGEPAVWLAQVEPESAAETLVEIAESALAPASLAVLEDAYQDLLKRRHDRRIQQIIEGGETERYLEEIRDGHTSFGSKDPFET